MKVGMRRGNLASKKASRPEQPANLNAQLKALLIHYMERRAWAFYIPKKQSIIRSTTKLLFLFLTYLKICSNKGEFGNEKESCYYDHQRFDDADHTTLVLMVI